MPAGKRQSNAMLYTLIIFVALFIAAVTAAIILYVKHEELKTIASDAKSRLEEVATAAELRKIGAIIGTKQRNKSRLGTMVDYLDKMVLSIVGGVGEDESAEVKVTTADSKIKNTFKALSQGYIDIDARDPNVTGLLPIIEMLTAKQDNITSEYNNLQKQFEELKNRFDDSVEAAFDKEQELMKEKERLELQVSSIKSDYEDLKALMEKTSDEQIRSLVSDLENEKKAYDKEHQDKLKLQAELKRAISRMENALAQLRRIQPGPDIDVTAFKSDGKVMLTDRSTKTVHVNIGSDNHVYRGLTFSVYDKNAPIPKDGKGKAEIEILRVDKNISTARIIRSEIKRPIVEGDIIANLIWDSEQANIFAIAGEFDLDGDNKIDLQAVNKIKTLIEKWGGRVAEKVSIDTDFLVLGRVPKTRRRPTFEEMEIYPLAMDRYEASVERVARYRELVNQAQALSVPVLNYERFLYLTGYKSLSVRPGAF